MGMIFSGITWLEMNRPPDRQLTLQLMFASLADNCVGCPLFKLLANIDLPAYRSGRVPGRLGRVPPCDRLTLEITFLHE